MLCSLTQDLHFPCPIDLVVPSLGILLSEALRIDYLIYPHKRSESLRCATENPRALVPRAGPGIRSVCAPGEQPLRWRPRARGRWKAQVQTKMLPDVTPQVGGQSVPTQNDHDRDNYANDDDDNSNLPNPRPQCALPKSNPGPGLDLPSGS